MKNIKKLYNNNMTKDKLLINAAIISDSTTVTHNRIDLIINYSMDGRLQKPIQVLSAVVVSN